MVDCGDTICYPLWIKIQMNPDLNKAITIPSPSYSLLEISVMQLFIQYNESLDVLRIMYSHVDRKSSLCLALHQQQLWILSMFWLRKITAKHFNKRKCFFLNVYFRVMIVHLLVNPPTYDSLLEISEHTPWSSCRGLLVPLSSCRRSLTCSLTYKLLCMLYNHYLTVIGH